jgi:RNA 3'-terminal phosphate cyclase
MNKVWTSEEKQFIKNNAGQMTDKVLSIKLSRITGRNITLQAVRKQRQKMGISKQPGRGICAIVEPSGENNPDNGAVYDNA